jgi:hypothetical protein
MGEGIQYCSFERQIMRYQKQSPSNKVVSAVTSFVAGDRLFGKPRPSTLELMLESRRLSRQVKDMSASYGLAGKAARTQGAIGAMFSSAWDTFMAYVMTILIASLRIALFFLFWGLLIMAVPVVINHL